MPNILVRRATILDSILIAELIAELGYPMPVELMRQKIEQLAGSEADCVYVAENEGQIIAVISVHVLPLFHAAGNMGRITSLVVNASQQRSGVGRKLIEAAEAFAREKGCIKMEVTSGNHREGAHAFYEKAGYEQSPHGRFIKSL